MAVRRSTRSTPGSRDIAGYEHTGKERLNNPEVGLVSPENDRDAPSKRYAYDPHLDPQLVWAGKAERLSFEVPTVSLHVHERIDPRTIIEQVRRGPGEAAPRQLSLFEPPAQETLYDQPFIDKSRARVTGPFTVEAVPAPTVRSVSELTAAEDALPAAEPEAADASVARDGETLRQAEWRDELLKAGIRGKGGQSIRFARVEPLPGARYLHADAETRPEDGAGAERVLISFGPTSAPLEQRQVDLALEEAETFRPRPALILFAAFQFDPEAAKDIDELTRETAGFTVLKVQMNADLLTEDLKKKRASNESFWLIGQPDVDLRRVAEGEYQGMWQVEVRGFDYYNTRTGDVDSGDIRRIAMWMLDPDYDGRSLYPRQVFFPLAGEKEGWARLARNLKAEIDEDRIDAYRGALSLPFPAGRWNRAAVKIVDDRGIESLKIVELG